MKIRIAVAVDRVGYWNSCGASGMDDKEKMDLACDCVEDGELRYWVECEIDEPRDIVISGRASRSG